MTAKDVVILIFNEIRKIIGDDEKADAVIALLKQSNILLPQKAARGKKQLVQELQPAGKTGRKLEPLPKNFAKVYELHQKGEITVTEAANMLGIYRKKYYRFAARYEEALKKSLF